MEMIKNNLCIKSSSGYNIEATLYIPLCSSNIKEVIIACHGFGGDKESSAIALLASKATQHNIGLICFDFPSHGQSKVDANFLTIDNCINDIRDVENYLMKLYSDVPISIFSTSFGAYITLLKIFKFGTQYNNIILRAPAIKMNEIFLNFLLKEDLEEFKQKNFTKLGFERVMNIPYSFYEELNSNNLFDLYNNNQKILILQGTEDDIAPIKDTYEFINLDNNNLSLIPIKGADHRMKKEGELEKVINLAMDYILKNNCKK